MAKSLIPTRYWLGPGLTPYYVKKNAKSDPTGNTMNREHHNEPGLGIKDPELFAHNLGRVVEELGKAASAYLKPREEGKATLDFSDNIAEVMKTLVKVSEYWLADPQRSLEAQSRLWGGYLALWSSSLKRMMGEPAPAAAVPDARDKRFTDPEWSSNLFFDFLKQVYLVTTRWAEDMVEQADGIDPHTRQKAAFYVKQIGNALAPSNFVLTNPELLRETLASNGENLVRGMHMLAEDIKAGGGDLRIRQSAAHAFTRRQEPGVDAGQGRPPERSPPAHPV